MKRKNNAMLCIYVQPFSNCCTTNLHKSSHFCSSPNDCETEPKKSFCSTKSLFFLRTPKKLHRRIPISCPTEPILGWRSQKPDQASNVPPNPVKISKFPGKAFTVGVWKPMDAEPVPAENRLCVIKDLDG